LNEVAIGMTMHHAGIELARNRLLPTFLQRSVVNAEIFGPEGALQAGILGILEPAEQLLERAQGEAEGLAKLNMTAHHQTKLKVRADYLATLAEAIEKDSANLGL